MALKRSFDILCAVIGIILFSPLMLITACLVRMFLGRPVLFKQTRPGFDGKPFLMIKFRTMRDSTDSKGKPLPDGERLTSLGRLLRATSLDELPELWNVLKGDMSIVGPRPLLMEYLGLYSEDQWRRHEVLPGITGWAQVNGRNALSWDEKFKLDVWYVDNRTFFLDLQIIFLTIKKVMMREGINAADSATVSPFTGSRPEGE